MRFDLTLLLLRNVTRTGKEMQTAANQKCIAVVLKKDEQEHTYTGL